MKLIRLLIPSYFILLVDFRTLAQIIAIWTPGKGADVIALRGGIGFTHHYIGSYHKFICLDTALTIIAQDGIVNNTLERSNQKELLRHMVERVIIDLEGTIRLELQGHF